MTTAYVPAAASDQAMRVARSELAGAVPLALPGLITALRIVVAIILALGVAREALIGWIGTDTILQDLRHFALDAERSLTSWYDSISMALSSLLLGLIALLARRMDANSRVQWSILAVIFMLMSIDATVSFHEVSVKPLRNAFDLGGIFYFSWVLLAAPLVVALGLYFIPFLLRLPRRTAIGFIVAGTVFVGGALGTEFLCGYLATTLGMDSLAYRATAAAQECLEAVGMTLFITALLRHLATLSPTLRLDLGTATG